MSFRALRSCSKLNDSLGLFDIYFVILDILRWLCCYLFWFVVHLTPKSWEQEFVAHRFQIMWPTTQAVVAAMIAAFCWKMGAGETLSFVYYKF